MEFTFDDTMPDSDTISNQCTGYNSTVSHNNARHQYRVNNFRTFSNFCICK